jgi:tetratricopeptide (TPR) repeat protein
MLAASSLVRRLAALLALAQPAAGHPDTWHTIELITAQIGTGDRRPALFYARGSEYRAVEKWAEAEADLRECLRQDPSFFPAQKDLGPVLLSAGRPDEALTAARDAVRLAAARAATSRASAWAELARIQGARGDWPAVVAATDEALRLVPRGEIDWYLLREQAFRAQGRLAAGITDLARGAGQLRSTLLRSVWIDALLDAGRASETLEPIEAALAETRHQAPWLVRRARARTLLGRKELARADGEAALAEVTARLVPEEPDPALLVVKGLALAGLGRRDEAVAALAATRALLNDPTLLAPLERVLAQAP